MLALSALLLICFPIILSLYILLFLLLLPQLWEKVPSYGSDIILHVLGQNSPPDGVKHSLSADSLALILWSAPVRTGYGLLNEWELQQWFLTCFAPGPGPFKCHQNLRPTLIKIMPKIQYMHKTSFNHTVQLTMNIVTSN